MIEPAREASGVAFRLYDARHTFVSTLVAAGIPLAEVLACSGHSVIDLSAAATAGNRRARSLSSSEVGDAVGQHHFAAFDVGCASRRATSHA